MAVSFEMKTNNTQQLLDELREKKEAALEAVGQAAETYAKLLFAQALLIADLPLDNPTEYTDLVCGLMK